MSACLATYDPDKLSAMNIVAARRLLSTKHLYRFNFKRVADHKLDNDFLKFCLPMRVRGRGGHWDQVHFIVTRKANYFTAPSICNVLRSSKWKPTTAFSYNPPGFSFYAIGSVTIYITHTIVPILKWFNLQNLSFALSTLSWYMSQFCAPTVDKAITQWPLILANR